MFKKILALENFPKPEGYRVPLWRGRQGLWTRRPGTGGRQRQWSRNRALGGHMRAECRHMPSSCICLPKPWHPRLYLSCRKLEVFYGKPTQPKKKDLKTWTRCCLRNGQPVPPAGKVRNDKSSHVLRAPVSFWVCHPWIGIDYKGLPDIYGNILTRELKTKIAQTIPLLPSKEQPGKNRHLCKE